MNIRHLPEPRFLRRHEVCARLGISQGQLYRLIAAGMLPRPRRISERIVGWIESDISRFITTRPIAEPQTPVAFTR